MRATRLVIAGSAHVDESARLQDALQPGESNRAKWSVSLGGVAANAARAANPICACTLISALGNDAAARSIESYFSNSGIACEFVRTAKSPSGRYTAVLDNQGELVLGLANTEITESLSAPDIITALARSSSTASHLAIDANLSARCIKALCETSPTAVISAIGVSPVKTMRLLGCGNRLDYLFVNRHEAASLADMPASAPLESLSEKLRQLHFTQHVITDGAKSVLVACAEQSRQISVAPARIDFGMTVNGAGDALAGATLAGLVTGKTLPESVTEFGLPTAAAVINLDQLPPELNRHA